MYITIDVGLGEVLTLSFFLASFLFTIQVVFTTTLSSDGGIDLNNFDGLIHIKGLRLCLQFTKLGTDRFKFFTFFHFFSEE